MDVTASPARLAARTAHRARLIHPLRANLAGGYAVTVQGLMRVIFVPAGDFQKLDDGTPDLSTVTAIEIVAVKDYHDK